MSLPWNPPTLHQAGPKALVFWGREWGQNPPLILLPASSRAQQLLRELQGQLWEAEGRRDATRQRLEGATKVLLAAGTGLEHLASKVQHLPLVSAPLITPGAQGQCWGVHVHLAWGGESPDAWVSSPVPGGV